MDPPAGTVSDGTEVSPQRYLADTVAGAAAIREFGVALDALGAGPDADQVEAAAPDLDAALANAELIAQRLDAESLADARLETQRRAAAAAYRRVVEQMRRVVDEAQAGRPVRLAEAVAEYQTAVDALRDELGEPATP